MRVLWEGLLGSMVVVPLVLAVGGVVVVGVVLQALNAVTGGRGGGWVLFGGWRGEGGLDELFGV